MAASVGIRQAEAIRRRNLAKQRMRARLVSFGEEAEAKGTDRANYIRTRTKPFSRKQTRATQRVKTALKAADVIAHPGAALTRLGLKTAYDRMKAQDDQISVTQQRQQLTQQRRAKAKTTRAAQKQAQFQQHYGIHNLMKSSIIGYLFYHVKERVAQTRFISAGTNGYYTGVPPSVFQDWFAGRASCITNDPSSLKRWTIGKTPSLGAFFNQKIKGKYTFHRGVFRP